MIKINDEVTIEGNIFMAPLAGVTDVPFRTIVKEMGADVTYTEMVSAKALHYGNGKTENLLNIAPNEKKVAVQLFGSDPDILGEIAGKLSEREEIILFDINMGCPAPKIVKNHEGAYLMKDPELAGRIIKTVRKNTDKPVTCKFRRGFEKGNETALQFAMMAEDSGAQMITVHGRYRDDFYSGKSDREIIKKIKESVKIPVIGNGDIFTGEDAVSMIEETGCDGIMVARGALGNPWIFRDIRAKLKEEEYTYPGERERIETALRQLAHMAELMPPGVAVREMRKHLAWYLKGMKDSASVKDKINKMEDIDEVNEVLTQYSLQF